MRRRSRESGMVACGVAGVAERDVLRWKMSGPLLSITTEQEVVMAKRVLIVLGVLVLVAAAAGGGYVYGTSVGRAQANQTRQRFAQERFGAQTNQTPGLRQTPPAGFPGGQGGLRTGGGIVGTIEAIEGDSLVVNTQEGRIRVRTTDTTLIEKLASVTIKDLKAGEQVMVAGSRNDDGSITARSVQSLRGGQASH